MIFLAFFFSVKSITQKGGGAQGRATTIKEIQYVTQKWDTRLIPQIAHVFFICVPPSKLAGILTMTANTGKPLQESGYSEEHIKLVAGARNQLYRLFAAQGLMAR